MEKQPSQRMTRYVTLLSADPACWRTDWDFSEKSSAAVSQQFYISITVFCRMVAGACRTSQHEEDSRAARCDSNVCLDGRYNKKNSDTIQTMMNLPA